MRPCPLSLAALVAMSLPKGSVGRGGRALDPAGSSWPRALDPLWLHETVEMVLLDDSLA